jgi:hypothetical protein
MTGFYKISIDEYIFEAIKGKIDNSTFSPPDVDIRHDIGRGSLSSLSITYLGPRFPLLISLQITSTEANVGIAA